MSLSDGDPADGGDIWFRIATQQGYISFTGASITVHSAAMRLRAQRKARIGHGTASYLAAFVRLLVRLKISESTLRRTANNAKRHSQA
jgi:hypothetical protein